MVVSYGEMGFAGNGRFPGKNGRPSGCYSAGRQGAGWSGGTSHTPETLKIRSVVGSAERGVGRAGDEDGIKGMRPLKAEGEHRRKAPPNRRCSPRALDPDAVGAGVDLIITSPPYGGVVTYGVYPALAGHTRNTLYEGDRPCARAHDL